MTITVEATYEDGVLKPDAPLQLQEKAKVRLTIEEPEAAKPEDEDAWKAIDALRGVVKGAPPDVSENHDKYLYGSPGK